MSRYSGWGPDVQRYLVRQQKRREAEARNAKTPPERRRAHRDGPPEARRGNR